MIEKSGIPTKINHGGANGADTLAEQWAKENEIETRIIRPNYKTTYGQKAPLMRNIILVRESKMILAIYNTNYRRGGTMHAANEAIKQKKPLLECYKDGRKIWTMPE